MSRTTDRATCVLVVDDDDDVRAAVRRGLTRQGLAVTEAENGTDALAVAANEHVDVMVLDVHLPDISGLEVLGELRRFDTRVHVIMLTGEGRERDRVLGLVSGADDYLVKPFSVNELAARVLTVQRRRRTEAPPPVLEAGGLKIDLQARAAHVRGLPVDLTRREFDLLAHLVSHPGQTFTRDELLERVWGSSAEWQTVATVTEHIRRLRTKIADDLDRGARLVTVRGVGYRFDDSTGLVPPDEPPHAGGGEASLEPSDTPIHAARRSEIKDAVARGEFVVHYQPMVDLESGRWEGVEALVRWQHPDQGLLTPADFMDAAETSDAVLELGEFVLDTACRQWATWHSAGHDVEIAVNLSGRELSDPGLARRIASALDTTGMPAEQLWLEVTETSLVQDLSLARSIMRGASDLGVRVAIDDFGTGWASLTYLRQFPVHALKIDRCFVQGMATSATDATIVSSIIRLASELDLTAIAEGIESPGQRTKLLQLGCRTGQGYLLGVPVPAAALQPLVR